MEEIIQFIQVTPEQLQQEIVSAINTQLRCLFNNFKLNNDTEYLTRKEVANLFSINLSTLNKWTNEGKLTSYGIGGRIYYKKNEIDASLIKLNNL